MQTPLSRDEIDALLTSQRVARLCFSAPGEHYLLPVGYVWLDGALNLMLSAGKKTDLLDLNARVAFQVDDSALAGVTAWRSVTGEGDTETIIDPASQQRVATALLERFPELRAWGEAETAGKKSDASLRFVRLVPAVMTGRRFSA